MTALTLLSGVGGMTGTALGQGTKVEAATTGKGGRFKEDTEVQGMCWPEVKSHDWAW